jgi:hypothetical protein
MRDALKAELDVDALGTAVACREPKTITWLMLVGDASYRSAAGAWRQVGRPAESDDGAALLEPAADVEAAAVARVRPLEDELASAVDDRHVEVVAVAQDPRHPRQAVFEVAGRLGGRDDQVGCWPRMSRRPMPIFRGPDRDRIGRLARPRHAAMPRLGWFPTGGRETPRHPSMLGPIAPNPLRARQQALARPDHRPPLSSRLGASPAGQGVSKTRERLPAVRQEAITPSAFVRQALRCVHGDRALRGRQPGRARPPARHPLVGSFNTPPRGADVNSSRLWRS